MPKSESVKLKELELQQQFITEVFGVLKNPLATSVLAVLVISQLHDNKLISRDVRFNMEQTCIAYPVIMAAAPHIPAIVDSIGKAVSGAASAARLSA